MSASSASVHSAAPGCVHLPGLARQSTASPAARAAPPRPSYSSPLPLPPASIPLRASAPVRGRPATIAQAGLSAAPPATPSLTRCPPPPPGLAWAASRARPRSRPPLPSAARPAALPPPGGPPQIPPPRAAAVRHANRRGAGRPPPAALLRPSPGALRASPPDPRPSGGWEGAGRREQKNGFRRRRSVADMATECKDGGARGSDGGAPL